MKIMAIRMTIVIMIIKMTIMVAKVTIMASVIVDTDDDDSSNNISEDETTVSINIKMTIQPVSNDSNCHVTTTFIQELFPLRRCDDGFYVKGNTNKVLQKKVCQAQLGGWVGQQRECVPAGE